MNTMNAIVKVAARGICGMISCGTCKAIFGIDGQCPYSIDVPNSDCVLLANRVMRKLREEDEVSSVTEDDLVDILSEEL